MISGGAWKCQLFAIDAKGGGKATKGFYMTISRRIFPSMPKGEIVGNIVIDGKGYDRGCGKGISKALGRRRNKYNTTELEF